MASSHAEGETALEERCECGRLLGEHSVNARNAGNPRALEADAHVDDDFELINWPSYSEQVEQESNDRADEVSS